MPFLRRSRVMDGASRSNVLLINDALLQNRIKEQATFEQRSMLPRSVYLFFFRLMALCVSFLDISKKEEETHLDSGL